MDRLAGLIAASHDQWLPPVVASILGTSDPVVTAEVVAREVSSAMGVDVVGARFYEPGVGIVVGLDLADGRAVVAKVHRNDYMSGERLAAIARVQALLAGTGLPAPVPLRGPIAVGHGWLLVEEYRPGDTADGYDAGVRCELATALWAFVDAARRHAPDGGLDSWLGVPVFDDLWPLPHDVRFDFAETSVGAEWIDDTARAARRVLTSSTLPAVIGHLDWRVQNLGFTDGRVSAIYDWDSLGLVPEAALVGVTSAVHPVDWRLDLPDPLPTLEQVDAFVVDYERARGEPFDEVEREVLAAAQRWVISYGARCQHSDRALGIFPDVDHTRGWPRLLRDVLAREPSIDRTTP